MRKIFLVCFLLISGCGGIPIDNTPAPLDNNFYTFEIDVCGTKGYGLNGCALDFNSPGGRTVEFDAFYKGEYVIQSDGCLFDRRSMYDDTERVVLSIGELIANRPSGAIACIFTMSIYPKKFDRGLSAKFILYNLEEFGIASSNILGREFHNGAGWVQVREGSNADLPIKFSSTKSGKFSFQGCGHRGDMDFNGSFEVTLSDLVSGDDLHPDLSCNYFFYLVYDDGIVETMAFTLSIYKDPIIHLPAPVIDFSKGKLCIKGDDSVGIISIGNKYKIDKRKMCEKVGNNIAWVRMATANGRTTLLGIKEGSIIWRPSLR